MKICNACPGDYENGKVTVGHYACDYHLGLYEGILIALVEKV